MEKCFSNSDGTEFKWQVSSPGTNWTIVSNKTQSTCKACFVNESINDYKWQASSPGNGYVKSTTIDNENSCIASPVCFSNNEETEFVWSDIKPEGTWKIIDNKDLESCKACFINYETKEAMWYTQAPNSSYEKVDISKNECLCQTITINKKDNKTNSVINGSILNLTDYDNIEVGSRELDVCPGKVYSLKEIKPTKGFILSNEDIKIEIKNNKLYINNNEKNNLTIDYNNTPNVLKIIKVDENNNNLSNAIVGIYKDDVEIMRITTEDENNIIERLEPGSYYVKEIKAPDNYALDSNIYPFEVAENGLISQNEITLTNYLMPEVRIHKLNLDTDTYIEDVEFIVKDDNGNIIETFKTTSESYNIRLPYGKYSIEEINTPISYIKNDEKYEFTLDSTSDKELDIKIYNKPYYTVKVIKQSYDGNKLAGAVFELINSNNEVIREITSTNDFVLIDKLPKGEYYLREIKAPEGYIKSDELIKFNVDYSENILEIVLFNEAIVPFTSKSINYYIISLVLLTFGILFVVYYIKTNKKEFVEPVLVKKIKMIRRKKS